MKHPVILGAAVVVAVIGLATGRNPVAALVAAAATYAILRIGVLMVGRLARPVPGAPAR